jgi:hypothetical protein
MTVWQITPIDLFVIKMEWKENNVLLIRLYTYPITQHGCIINIIVMECSVRLHWYTTVTAYTAPYSKCIYVCVCVCVYIYIYIYIYIQCTPA